MEKVPIDVKKISAVLDLNCKQMETEEGHTKLDGIKRHVQQMDLKALVACSNRLGDNPATLFVDYHSDPEVRRLRGELDPKKSIALEIAKKVNLEMQLTNREKALAEAMSLFITTPVELASGAPPAEKRASRGWLADVFGKPVNPAPIKSPSLAEVIRGNVSGLSEASAAYHTPITVMEITARPKGSGMPVASASSAPSR